jgi:exosortase
MNRLAESSLGSRAHAEGVRVRMTFVLMLACACIAVLLAYPALRSLMSAGRNDYYSHIFLIPFVTGYFLFAERKRIFSDTRYCWTAGTPLIAAGLLAYAFALWQKERLGANDFASLSTASCILVFWGGFVLSYGRKTFRAGLFPLLFLLFAIPIPTFLLDRFIHVLRVGSTEVTQRLYDVTGTAYFREGFAYQLTGINIEVAKECSGIRSTLALIISCVVAGRLFLKSGWRRLVLVIAILPITIFKNAVRILTLSLLAVYVDTRFISESWLHHSGGIVFYLPALGLLGGILWWLRKGEKGSE